MRYDAVQFLESLFRRDLIPVAAILSPANTIIPDLTPDDLSPQWREEYEERAAIREYDGDTPRELAEHYALLDVLQMMKTSTK